MGLQSSKTTKDTEFAFYTLVTLRNGKFEIHPEINEIYRETLRHYKDCKVAIISVIGPPNSGKTTLLKDAMRSLIPKNEVDKGGDVKFYRTRNHSEDNSCLLLISSVNLGEKNSNLVVFGLDIHAGDYSPEAYELLIDFAIYISSVTLVSLPEHFEPAFWNCERTFSKVHAPPPSLQTAGILVFQDSVSTKTEPYGITNLSAYLLRPDVDPERKKAIQIIYSAYNRVELSFLPIPTLNDNRHAPGSPHSNFFSLLFGSNIHPVRRGNVTWDFNTLYDCVINLCKGPSSPGRLVSEPTQTSHLQTVVALTSKTGSQLKSGVAGTYHQSEWLRAYDDKFHWKQRNLLSAFNPVLTLKQLQDIHQEISAELWAYFKAQGGPPDLYSLLTNRFHFYSNQQNEVEQHFKDAQNEFHNVFLLCKKGLSAQLIHQSLTWNQFKAKVNYTITQALSYTQFSPMESCKYVYDHFRSVSTQFGHDLCLVIDMITTYQQSIESFLNLNICFPQDELFRESETIRSKTIQRGTFSNCYASSDFLKLVHNFIDNQYEKMLHLNACLTSLENQLIATAIEYASTQYQTTLSKIVGNRILSEHQLRNLHNQLQTAAENAFIPTRPANGFKFPYLWKLSKSRIRQELQREYEKVRQENSQRLSKYLERTVASDRALLPSPSQNQYVFQMTSTGHTDRATESSSTSFPADICIHLKQSEFIFSWKSPSSGISFRIIPPRLRIYKDGTAIIETCAPATVQCSPSDHRVFNICDLISLGLPTDKLCRGANKLLGQRIQDAQARLNAPGATSMQLEAALRSLKATEQAFKVHDD